MYFLKTKLAKSHGTHLKHLGYNFEVKLVLHYLSTYKTEGKVNHNIMAITYTVGFWCQAIHKKILPRFDTSFDIKMMMKIYAIEIIFKSHEPLQSCQLTGSANSAKKAG